VHIIASLPLRQKHCPGKKVETPSSSSGFNLYLGLLVFQRAFFFGFGPATRHRDSIQFVSFPRKRESCSVSGNLEIPAFAGTTPVGVDSASLSRRSRRPEAKKGSNRSGWLLQIGYWMPAWRGHNRHCGSAMGNG